ncbi:ABC transporter permease, partial [Halorubrum sp. E3]
MTITFFLANQIPGDPVDIMLGPTPAQEQVEAIRAQYGLDRPIHVRYFAYLSSVATGDLG